MVCASNPPPPPPQSKPTQPTSRRLPNKPQKRSADQCKAGDSYVREKFRPGPTREFRNFTDIFVLIYFVCVFHYNLFNLLYQLLIKEKRRLQKILEMGKDEPKVTIKQQPPIAEAPEQKDLLEEIEERCQFLEDMASLGQEQQYVNVINTEISQVKLISLNDNEGDRAEGKKLKERKQITLKYYMNL
uniref:Uncharacterized protein n=1 Tax=Periophthalmus magnuspinnatus TaxID=409849 RepID=A0A3B3ZXH2_9GOBI